MKLGAMEIFEEFEKGNSFKNSLGNKGLYEQSKINERFYIGDQWHGAKCGNERPLVRHNIIKRIGEYKISQIMNSDISVDFAVNGIGEENAVNVMTAFENYFKTSSERVRLNDLNDKILKNAYICGTGVIYTYWNSDIPTGVFSDKKKSHEIKGDIACEVLNINDIVFADPYCEDIQNQSYIIIGSEKLVDDVLREARLSGADLGVLRRIEEKAADGKVKVLTKLYKERKLNGKTTVKAIKVVDGAIIKPSFDTGLRLYPLAVFCWDRKSNCAYGESEVTYLIPNQIAINRMITANVWATMTSGMPIMLVNGDTVTDKITNDPGQIIKVYGNNEDVSGAVKYIAPPIVASDFDSSINTLIENTLTQSGANEVALGDSKADNATALATMRNAALLPLQIVRSRFYVYIEDLARIWADFWVSCYGKRIQKVNDKKEEYIDFNAEEFTGLAVNARVSIRNPENYSSKERMEILFRLFEKGIIDKTELLKRMPEGSVENIKTLIKEESNERV